MGRRRQKKIIRKKRKFSKLDTEFNCPFCHHTKAIGIKLDRQKGVADLCCRVCGVSYTIEVGRLDEAVDVYSSWIDKCIEVNHERIESEAEPESEIVPRRSEVIGTPPVDFVGDGSFSPSYSGPDSFQIHSGETLGTQLPLVGETRKRRLLRLFDRYAADDNGSCEDIDQDDDALFGQDDD